MARNKALGGAFIANGTALSVPFNLSDKVLCAVIIPPTWTPAALTFQASDDGGATFNSMFDDQGVEVTVASASVVAGQRISLDPSTFCSVDFIKVRSGTSGAPVNQAGDRHLTLVSRKFYALD